GSITVASSTFSGNSAEGFVNTGLESAGLGGAILNAYSLEVTGSTFSGNVATPGGPVGGGGGAVFNDGTGTAAIDGSTLSRNQAQDGTGSVGVGGAILNYGTLTLTASTLSGNSDGVFDGGPQTINGIFFPGVTEVTNSTFYANVGYAVSGGTMSITSSTLAGNAVGILSIGAVSLKNTILSKNAQGNCATELGAAITSEDHNISDDTTCAAFLEQPNDFAPHTDPGLDNDLKDNGGPTKTLALTISSVAVDAVPPADCAVSTDQRGVLRPQGTNCDIGAFEATPDFYFSPISAISTTVGSSGSANVLVNSFVGFHSAVTLAATSVPTGIATSFSPNPVTPPSYGSTSSMLTVNIGPAVTPATYTVGVKGWSGTPVHSTSVKVTVGVTTAGVAQVVGADQAAGCIDNSGVANAVTSKLAQAQADIDAGDTAEARAILTDLLALLQAQRGKHIKTSCTISRVTFDPDAVLIADVQALLAGL
ncbi:MAG TPA: choice-of-anchor Q domain-containing protein, partial [Casimicrobiaceae bacterium]|nr:choice-of-anchor Q domain-containing protein [Casimicrobiaceae bacterium]